MEDNCIEDWDFDDQLDYKIVDYSIQVGIDKLDIDY